MSEAKKNQQNLQLLDILACDSANKPPFKNLTQTDLPNGTSFQRLDSALN